MYLLVDDLEIVQSLNAVLKMLCQMQALCSVFEVSCVLSYITPAIFMYSTENISLCLSTLCAANLTNCCTSDLLKLDPWLTLKLIYTTGASF